MRVLCNYFAEEIEGEIVVGRWCDPERTVFDFDGQFRIRCDDGYIFRVSGHVCTIEVLEGSTADLARIPGVVYRADEARVLPAPGCCAR